MHPRYPNVFRPIRLGPIELRNRFYSSPHPMPASLAGMPTDDVTHYAVARARGGCGLIFMGIAALARARAGQLCAHPKEHIPAFRAVAAAVHDAGARIFGEPYYHWSSAGSWQPYGPFTPALGPSVSQYSYNERRWSTREMSQREILSVIDAFRQSTAHLREAGFDGVMLHATHGALIEQFLSPYFNRRTDAYGGSLENRMRFLTESLRAVREAADGKMAVGVRLNCDELTPGGYVPKDAREVLGSISAAGLVDFVDLDVAIEPDQYHLGMPPVLLAPHVYAPYVEAVRGAAGGVPVLSVLGRLTSVADGEAALASGVCDMVGAARALIAEPDLVRNAFEGKEDRSRRCIACNACMTKVQEGARTCAINPSSWRERLWGADSFIPARCRSKVVVAGGGPAGLEAARVSALKGHEVELFEAREELGGALRLWAALPGRTFFRNAIHWWDRELRRLGVKIHLNREVTASEVLRQRPDAVIVATGARYSEGGRSNYRDLDIAGCDRDFVYRPEEILLGRACPAGKVVLLDGEGIHTGVGLAEFLGEAGADVEYLTPYLTLVSPHLCATQDAPFIMKRLRAARVKLSPSTYIKRIGEHEVIAFDVHSEEERIIDSVDAVILAGGRIPVNGLEKKLEGKVPQLFTIGDALAVRMWATAAYEGHRFARCIGEPEAPGSVIDAYFGSDDPGLTLLPANVPRTTRHA